MLPQAPWPLCPSLSLIWTFLGPSLRCERRVPKARSFPEIRFPEMRYPRPPHLSDCSAFAKRNFTFCHDMEETGQLPGRPSRPIESIGFKCRHGAP